MNNESTTALGRYLSTIKNIPLLTKTEFIELHVAYIAGDESIKQKLIRHNLRLSIKCAKGYTNDEQKMMDLIQEGNLGLIRAVEKYDSTKLGKNGKSYAFSTYAEHWIRYRIEKFLSENQCMITVPLHMMKLTRKVYRMKEKATEAGETLNVSEVAAELNKKESAIKAVLNIMQAETSMQSQIHNSEGSQVEFGDAIAQEQDHLPQEVESGTKWLYLQVEQLPQNQKDAVIHMFGLYNTMQKNGQQTGQIMGVSRERVRQLVIAAKEKLIRAARRDGVDMQNLAI